MSEVHVRTQGSEEHGFDRATSYLLELFEVRPIGSVVSWVTPPMQTDEITLAELG